MSSDTSQEEHELIALRKAKLDKLRAEGAAFPNDFRRTHLSDALHLEHGDSTKEFLAESNVPARVAGRIVLKRVMGKASFLTLQDGAGRIQLYVTEKSLGSEDYEGFKNLDIGDIVGAVGVLMKTMKGELSLAADSVRLLTKSLRPLPEKHKGLTDTETRYRQRYIDLMVLDGSRLHGSRNPDDAIDSRRSHCSAVYHALQCARCGYVSASGARAQLEAVGGWRL